MAGLLAMVLVVTIAVRLPAAVGLIEKVTVNLVVEAVVTAPTAPLLNTTVLLAAVAENPNPSITTVLALAAKASVLDVTAGTTLATCTAAAAAWPLVVTVADRLPTAVGLVVKVTVRAVVVAVVTVPMAPLLKATVFSEGTVLNPAPLITTVVALAAKLSSLRVTTGFTEAT